MAHRQSRGMMIAICCATALNLIYAGNCSAQYLENIAKCTIVVKDKVEKLHAMEMRRIENQLKIDVDKFIRERNDEVKRYLKQQNAVDDQCRIAIRDLQIHGDALDKDSYDRSINVTISELKAIKREPFKRPTAEENLTKEERLYRNLRADGRSEEDAKNLSGFGAALAASKFILQNQNLEELYYSHRSISTPPSLTFSERCLRAVLFKNNTNYASSEDYVNYTSAMDDQQKTAEQKSSLSVCPIEAASSELVDKIAKSISDKLGNEWRQSAERRQAERDIESARRDAELEARFRPTAETEAGALPLTCTGTAQSSPDRTIGRIFVVPSGQDIALSTASGISNFEMYQDNENYLASMLRRSGEISGSKAAATLQINQARQRFFNTTPDTSERKSANVEFGDLLTAKDLFYLSQYVPEGTGLKAQERADALKIFTGGNEIDGGIHGEDWSDFSMWVDAVRGAMQAPPPGKFWLPTPNQYSDALKFAMPRYVAYKRRRDATEFDRWNSQRSPKPIPPKSIEEKITKYFEYIFDPQIQPNFCSANVGQRELMTNDRRVTRALIYAWENISITPTIVMDRILSEEHFKTKDDPSKLDDLKRMQANFQNSVDRQRAAGETDLKMISLKAMQEVYLAGRPRNSSFLIALSTIESNIKVELQNSIGLEEKFDKIRSKYELRIPSYGAVAGVLARGEYSRLPQPRP